VYPIFGVLGVAAAVCGGYIIKHFSGSTDIAFSKSVRMDHNHQGGTDARISSHNSRFGMREINKSNFNMFPFSWTSKDGTRTLLVGALRSQSCLPCRPRPLLVGVTSCQIPVVYIRWRGCASCAALPKADAACPCDAAIIASHRTD